MYLQVFILAVSQHYPKMVDQTSDVSWTCCIIIQWK